MGAVPVSGVVIPSGCAEKVAPGGDQFFSYLLVEFLGVEQVGPEPVALNWLVDAYEGSGAVLEPVLVLVSNVLVGAVNVQPPEKSHSSWSSRCAVVPSVQVPSSWSV